MQTSDAGEEQSAQKASPEPPLPVSRAPQSLSLDDLIPEGAVDNAQEWASQSGDDLPALAAQEDVQKVLQADADSEPASRFDLDEALDAFEVPIFEPLSPDPQRPDFADIEAPDLVDLPPLSELALSDTLTLAFPTDVSLFPERDAFIARFLALSSVEALESDDDTVPQLAARARSDEQLLDELLRTYGYYAGDIIRQLSGGRRGFAADQGEADDRKVDLEPSVRFDVIPGSRYAFGSVDLGALDELAGHDGSALRESFGIRAGDPLYADRIVSQERVLRLALGESGFPFAQLAAPNLTIDHAREEGDLSLLVEPGGKFAFGQLVSSDPEFLSGRHLQRIARFEPGDIYQTSLQSDLRRAILATGLVSSVAITPRAITPSNEEGPREVALDIEMERAPLRTISGALGYGTEDGVKLEAAWEHRNLFPPEGALRLRGIVGTREQLASVTYRRSNFRGRDQILTVDAYVSDIETEAVDARTVALRGAFERVSNLLFQKPLSWQVGAELLYTDERNREANTAVAPITRRQTYTIAGLFGSATLDSSDDLLDPTEGYRATLSLTPEFSRSEGLDSYYLRAQADASAYHSFGDIVLAGRVRAATIQGASAANIAPSRRLYSGGGGSVRGYGFQAIGPRDAIGNPTGGASLVEGAVEARIQTGLLGGALEIVPFLDAGSVSTGSSPNLSSVKYGAGLGVRYKTSFGPIRLDLGVPLNPTQFDAPVVVYVSLGQAF